MYLFIEVSQPTLCLCFSRVWLTADSMFVFQPSVTDSRLCVCVSAECDWQTTLCLCFSRVWLTDDSMFVFQPSVALCLCFSRLWLTDNSMFVFQLSVTLCLCFSRVLLYVCVAAECYCEGGHSVSTAAVQFIVSVFKHWPQSRWWSTGRLPPNPVTSSVKHKSTAGQ